MNLIILLVIANNYMPFQSLWDFYSDNRVSSSACGRGYTGIASTGDISSVFINPASLSLENKRQYYFEYTYKNNVEWDTNRTLQELHPNFSAGHALYINDFLQIGTTYRVEKSLSFDEQVYIRQYILQDSAIIWAGSPGDSIPFGWEWPDSLSMDTIVDTIDPYIDLKISSFSIPIVINFKNILRIGLDINYLTFYSKSGNLTTSKFGWRNIAPTKFSKIIPKFGFIYSPKKNLSFGLIYTPKTNENITVGDFPFSDYAGTNVFPTKIGIGINYKFNSFPLSLSFDYIHSHNSIEENLLNRNDIHLGLEYDIINNFKLRTGFFTQRDYRNSETQEYYQENFGIGNYNQIFTTLGLSYKISSLTLNLSLMDSHLFSNGYIEQTYVNTGITYGF